MNNYSYKIHYVYESLSLLNVLVEPAPYFKPHMDKSAVDYDIIPGPREEKFVELLQRIEDDAREEFAQDIDDIKSYYALEDKISYSFASMLLLHDSVCPAMNDIPENISIKDYQKYIKDIPEESYNKYFYQLIRRAGKNASDNDDAEYAGICDIIDAIYEMDIADSDKLKLQQLYIHRSEHIPKLLTIISRAAKVLKRYEKKLEEFGKDTIDYAKKDAKDEPYVDYVMKKMGYSSSGFNSSNDCYITLSYLNCMKVSLSFKGDDIKTARPIAQIGAIYSDSLTYDKIMIKRKSITQDKALTILKLLSDKSKLEILQLTRDEAYYGAQLANKIGLTTATISHHTSALFEQSLLQIEKVDSKIFYKQNQETIKSLIKYLEDTLLK